MRTSKTIGLVALYLIAPTTFAAEISAKIQWIGIYENSSERRIIISASSPTGDLGLDSGVQKIVKHTTTIPAKLGLNFGFGFTVSGANPGTRVPLLMRVTVPNPGLMDSKAKNYVRTIEIPFTCKATNVCSAGWEFSEESELIKGTWQFEVLSANTSIAKQDFTVEK